MNIHYEQSKEILKLILNFRTDSLRYLLRKYLIRFDFFSLPCLKKGARVRFDYSPIGLKKEKGYQIKYRCQFLTLRKMTLRIINL